MIFLFHFFFVILFILVSLFLIFASENVLLFSKFLFVYLEMSFFYSYDWFFVFPFILFWAWDFDGHWGWVLGLENCLWLCHVDVACERFVLYDPRWRFLLNVLLTFWFHLNRGGLKMDWWVWFICWVFGVCGLVVEVGSFGTF